MKIFLILPAIIAILLSATNTIDAQSDGSWGVQDRHLCCSPLGTSTCSPTSTLIYPDTFSQACASSSTFPKSFSSSSYPSGSDKTDYAAALQLSSELICVQKGLCQAGMACKNNIGGPLNNEYTPTWVKTSYIYTMFPGWPGSLASSKNNAIAGNKPYDASQEQFPLDCRCGSATLSTAVVSSTSVKVIGFPTCWRGPYDLRGSTAPYNSQGTYYIEMGYRSTEAQRVECYASGNNEAKVNNYLVKFDSSKGITINAAYSAGPSSPAWKKMLQSELLPYASPPNCFGPGQTEIIGWTNVQVPGVTVLWVLDGFMYCASKSCGITGLADPTTCPNDGSTVSSYPAGSPVFGYLWKTDVTVYTAPATASFFSCPSGNCDLSYSGKWFCLKTDVLGYAQCSACGVSHQMWSYPTACSSNKILVKSPTGFSENTCILNSGGGDICFTSLPAGTTVTKCPGAVADSSVGGAVHTTIEICVPAPNYPNVITPGSGYLFGSTDNTLKTANTCVRAKQPGFQCDARNCDDPQSCGAGNWIDPITCKCTACPALQECQTNYAWNAQECKCKPCVAPVCTGCSNGYCYSNFADACATGCSTCAVVNCGTGTQRNSEPSYLPSQCRGCTPCDQTALCPGSLLQPATSTYDSSSCTCTPCTTPTCSNNLPPSPSRANMVGDTYSVSGVCSCQPCSAKWTDINFFNPTRDPANNGACPAGYTTPTDQCDQCIPCTDPKCVNQTTCGAISGCVTQSNYGMTNGKIDFCKPCEPCTQKSTCQIANFQRCDNPCASTVSDPCCPCVAQTTYTTKCQLQNVPGQTYYKVDPADSCKCTPCSCPMYQVQNLSNILSNGCPACVPCPQTPCDLSKQGQWNQSICTCSPCTPRVTCDLLHYNVSASGCACNSCNGCCAPENCALTPARPTLNTTSCSCYCPLTSASCDARNYTFNSSFCRCDLCPVKTLADCPINQKPSLTELCKCVTCPTPVCPCGSVADTSKSTCAPDYCTPYSAALDYAQKCQPRNNPATGVFYSLTAPCTCTICPTCPYPPSVPNTTSWTDRTAAQPCPTCQACPVADCNINTTGIFNASTCSCQVCTPITCLDASTYLSPSGCVCLPCEGCCSAPACVAPLAHNATCDCVCPFDGSQCDTNIEYWSSADCACIPCTIQTSCPANEKPSTTQLCNCEPCTPSQCPCAHT